MDWKFFIYYLIAVLLVNYIINDFKKDKAKKSHFDCSTCKVRGCRGHYCAEHRRVLENGVAEEKGSQKTPVFGDRGERSKS